VPRGVALLAILLLLILSAIVAAVGLRGPSEPDPARELAVLTGGDPDRGRETIRQNGCPTCHIISGISEAKGLVGPPLDHFASRAYIGGVVPNTPANLVAWIRNPPGIDSMTAMTATGLSEVQARDAAAYLYTLP
jgi:cytochrome c